jgi:glycosyltransferase involved in cell wall biosynthesis
MEKESKIWIAIPAMQESQWLPQTLQSLEQQSYSHFEVVVCVNQPDSYCESLPNTHESTVFMDNRHLLEKLNAYDKLSLAVLDKSSPGLGWPDGKGSVGAARKYIMDFIAEKGNDNDIIVSLDADTLVDRNYLESIAGIFRQKPEIIGLSNPYYHRLTGEEAKDRAILRYEIYMRNYALNLFRIDNPYRFTALGSAMATTVKNYKSIGGLTPKKSGEDFYFLQKLLKKGPLCVYNHRLVYPAARFSDRVFFGTGTAMIKGNYGDWSSYPVYEVSLFDQIRETCQKFEELFEHDLETPMDALLQVKANPIWEKLRRNSRNPRQFARSCHEKVDGLRILQFLKSRQETVTDHETRILIKNLTALDLPIDSEIRDSLLKQKELTAVPTPTLSLLRDLLFERQQEWQSENPLTQL